MIDRQPLSTITPRVLVIGCGNDLRGDDALGPMAARKLAKLLDDRDDVRVEVCQGLTPDLALPLSQCETAVFIDCSTEGPIGEVVRREVAPSDGAGLSMVHFLDPQALLTWTQSLYGRMPCAVTLTAAGRDFAISESLSPLVAAALPAIVDRVMKEIGEVCHA